METREIASRKTVGIAYNCLDAIFTPCGIRDLTDGIYCLPDTSYQRAQEIQREWLLDQVGCIRGSWLLDIGCGYGTLLEDAARRGARVVGITLSHKQARYCQRRGLDVRVCDYRDFASRYWETFDCIVANGSLEHFVQPQDALAGQQEAIYREFFRICHLLLDSRSSSRRLVTTAIHFNRFTWPRPENLLKSPWKFPWGSDDFHAALLEQCLGGFYPRRVGFGSQLEECCWPYFRMEKAVDGTQDYRQTSEQWLQMIKRRMWYPRSLAKILASWAIYPRQMSLAMLSLLAESWQWQFRGVHAPMKLWRHVWQAL